MSVYNIQRWDAINVGCGDFDRPAIYIKPDTDFLQYAKLNNNQIRLIVSGTTSPQYDGNLFWGTVDKSNVVPSCRPNFFDATNMYIITLNGIWNGYPKALGEITLIDGPVGPTGQISLANVDKTNLNSVIPKLTASNPPSSNSSTTKKGFDRFQVLVILTILLSFFIFVQYKN